MQEKVYTKALEAASSLKVRSALNPILWLCGIITIPAIMALSFTGRSEVWLIALALFPVGAAILGFFFLLIFDRDKLQSEEFQLRNRTLNIMQQKGQAIPYVVSSVDLDVIPKPNQLTSGEENL